MKQCKDCKEWKELSYFGKLSSYKSGYDSKCKNCRNIINRKNYKNRKNIAREKRNDQRIKRINNGLCERCGSPNLLKGTTYCENHYIRSLAIKTLGSGTKQIIERLKEKFYNNPYCPYTNDKLILGENAGIDHIIPVSVNNDLFSDIDNVEWVRRDVNRIKNFLTKNEFIEFCKKIYKYYLQTKDQEKNKLNYIYKKEKMEITKKFCVQCNIEKKVNHFRKNKFCEDGYRKICKECQKINKENNLTTREVRLMNGLCSHCDNERIENSNLFCDLHYVYSISNQTLHDGTINTAITLLENLYNYPWCPYTGEKLVLGFNASIDHIKSTRNHPELESDLSNVEWISSYVNKIKNFQNKEEFIELCKKITENYS